MNLKQCINNMSERAADLISIEDFALYLEKSIGTSSRVFVLKREFYKENQIPNGTRKEKS